MLQILTYNHIFKKTMKLIHNQFCSKSQCALSFLVENSIETEIIEYLKKPMNFEQIQELLIKLKIKAVDLVRKSEPIYKKKFEGKELTETEWIVAMVEHPILIERPIFVHGNKAVIARPIDRIKEILKD